MREKYQDKIKRRPFEFSKLATAFSITSGFHVQKVIWHFLTFLMQTKYKIQKRLVLSCTSFAGGFSELARRPQKKLSAN
jgi:hypothetical protein